MSTPNPSQKRQLIDKANQRVLVITSLAAFIVIFCLVASKTLFGQLLYQNRIVQAKKTTLSQLKKDFSAAQNLETAYQAYISTPQNVIGGNPSGSGPNDGDNGKIVLDALPGQYDFPALATSLTKLLSGQGVKIQSISGTDDEVAQSEQAQTATPQPVPIPFQVSANGNYQAIVNTAKTFEASIRPIQVQTITLSGDDANLNLTLAAQTYYQPQKTFNLSTKVIK
ncbi:hypothetical protein KC976_01525 [Candidatus Saccharibacteria bacterium]|jgi:hypothetical protein|nr:hypothetical protein [Candidatus Saccharibacteria bacterium]HPG37622.1 hypothetical protein [Candidatus Saccharibacteria bacterium]